MSTLLKDAIARHEAKASEASVTMWPLRDHQARLAVVCGDAHVARVVADPFSPQDADRIVALAVRDACRLSAIDPVHR
jgi:hypothetical protein